MKSDCLHRSKCIVELQGQMTLYVDFPEEPLRSPIAWLNVV